MARSLSSPRPRTRVWLCLWRLTADGGSLSRALALSSVHSRCLPHRTAAARGGVPSFPSGSSVRSSVCFWGVVRVSSPVGGKGERPASASRRPLAVAPGRACRTEPASCEGARSGASWRRRSSLPRLPPPTPVRVPSYRVPARRFKDPRGGPLGAVGVRRLPRTPVPHAAGGRSRGAPPRSGSGSPLSGARGARLRVPGSPVRRRSRAPCPSVPTRFPGVFLPCLSLAGPRRTPLRSPAASPRGGGWRGDCAAVSSYPKGKRSYDS